MGSKQFLREVSKYVSRADWDSVDYAQPKKDVEVVKLEDAKVQDFCSSCGKMKPEIKRLFILSSSTGFAEVFCPKCLKLIQKIAQEEILDKRRHRRFHEKLKQELEK